MRHTDEHTWHTTATPICCVNTPICWVNSRPPHPLRGVMRYRPQVGFSMVEVLVSLLVLSLGLLGLAALQSNSVKATHSAHLRSQATFYAHDILERMRANRKAARAGSYDLTLTATTPVCSSSAYDLVKCDLAEWRADLSSLPTGTGAVSYDAATQLVTVMVRWNDQRAGGSTTASLTIQAQL